MPSLLQQRSVDAETRAFEREFLRRRSGRRLKLLASMTPKTLSDYPAGMTLQTQRLFFLPGASGNTQFWRPLAARLSHPGERRFFGWPGFGGMPADPSVSGLRDLGQRVAAELTSPTALLAQSMGGVIAMLAALEKPALVTHLVLSTTSGGLDVSALGGYDWRGEFRAQNPHLPRWFESERWDLTPRFAEIRMPVLLLWGDADPISPVAVGERLRASLPCAELVVIPGGTHDLVLERAEELAPQVERHLTKQD
jgi:pimeloyl-ACP methyl ester carboxylesterase